MPLCIKVRWKMLLLFFCLTQVVSGSGPRCDKRPTGQEPYKQGGDGGFSISVAGSPTLYRPGQEYTVSLSGMRLNDGHIEATKIKFIDYTLVAESDLPATEISNLGTFQVQPGDAMTKFSHRCSHAVKATSAIPKDEITVQWTAPEPGNGCIQLKVMVVERKDVWYMDDGGLTYTFCEDDSPMGTVPVVEPCCACDEAKYEVIFEGLWSRHTHPKDYPIDEWKTQFSHLIGASHSIDYDLWKYGELSSPALTMLAATGQTKKLEIDMKRFSKNIRSVIKARGLQQRSNVVGRTFAVFRMDPTNHLLSLVSKMIPSPDWIVGVSLENLCLANCSWVDSRVVDLYPWDGGVRSGVTYNNPGDDTVPREVIHRITACRPDNEESPFFDPTCAPLKPVARLHILKQREYKKQCSNGQEGPGIPLNPSWGSSSMAGGPGDIYSGQGIGPSSDDNSNPYADYGSSGTYNDNSYADSSSSSYSSPYSSSSSSYSSNYGANGDLCQMKEWTDWTECSQTCGQGSQSRTRVWMNPVGSTIANCPKEKLFAKRTCENTSPCPARNYDNSYNPFYTEDELMSGYSSQWSRRGLTTGNLKKEDESSGGTKSYLYGGGEEEPTRQVYSSVNNPSTYMDPYHDPYNKYSGYTKQKGYPPQTNKPGSHRYNPYKALGYYGYTYAGPSSGPYGNAQAPYQTDPDLQSNVQGDSTTVGGCETEEWADWSECSAVCGSGTKSRKRFYVGQDSSLCSEELYQTEPCEETSGCGDDNTPSLPTPLMRTRHQLQQQRPGPVQRRGPYRATDPQCSVADWSEWSPCSVSCGHGHNIRTRVFTLSFVPNRICEGVRLTEKKDCRLQDCWTDYYDDEEVFDMDDMDDDEPVTIEVMEDEAPAEPYCQEDPDPGRCRMAITRWYYNPREGNCQEYKYSGCGGNRNSFVTMESCMQTCHKNRRESVFKDLMSMSLVREDYKPQPVPCKVSEWSEWSECSNQCGRGWMTMTRTILAREENGGRACPKKLEKRRKCRGQRCAVPPSDWYAGSWRMLQDNDDIRN